MSLFNKKTWADREVQYPKRYVMTQENGSTQTVTLERDEGSIITAGDLLGANNLNGLETRIDEGLDETQAAITDDIDTRLNVLRFGVDDYGNYGYKKEGADTVVPFRNTVLVNITHLRSYSNGGTAATLRDQFLACDPNNFFLTRDTGTANVVLWTIQKAGYYCLWTYASGAVSHNVRFYPLDKAFHTIYGDTASHVGWIYIDREENTSRIVTREDLTSVEDAPVFRLEVGDRIRLAISASTTNSHLVMALFYKYDGSFDRVADPTYPVRVL